MKGIYTIVAAVVAVSVPVSLALADDNDGRRANNVLDHGAVCDGHHDDTHAFTQAVAKTPVGGILRVHVGKCVLSDTIVITKPITLIGSGFGSQIYGKNAKTLFLLDGVNNAVIRDLYLGSASNAAGVSLLELKASHHNRVENVSMLGGYYGLFLNGALINTIIDLRSGTNFGGFFATTAVTNTWVRGQRFDFPSGDPRGHYSANANTFIAPVLEGGVNGIWITDTQAEGSITVVGGTIEGVSGTGLYLEKTFLSSTITGTHFESNGVADVTLQGTFNVRMAGIVALTKVNLVKVGAFTTKNVQISDSIVEKIHIDNPSPFSNGRIQLQNITHGLAACNPGDYDIQDASVIQVNVACYPN